MLKLSNRMRAIANMVEPCEMLVDVGTDHGFLPIYLVKNHICTKAIAVDVNQGPLMRAQEHIRQEELTNQITTRLSNGFMAIEPGEAQAAIIAGMGGLLMESILSNGVEVIANMSQLILQPQSDFLSFRRFLYRIHCEILEENMMIEEGKYYTIFKARPNSECSESDFERLRPEEKRYGCYFFANPNDVFKQYLIHERKVNAQVKQRLLLAKDCEKIEIRKKEDEEKLSIIQSALNRM